MIRSVCTGFNTTCLRLNAYRVCMPENLLKSKQIMLDASLVTYLVIHVKLPSVQQGSVI